MKLRVDGETISPEKTYSGKHVLHLLEVSFENGIRRGKAETEKDASFLSQNAYSEGYKAGYEEASKDLLELKKLLQQIIGLEGST